MTADQIKAFILLKWLEIISKLFDSSTNNSKLLFYVLTHYDRFYIVLKLFFLAYISFDLKTFLFWGIGHI